MIEIDDKLISDSVIDQYFLCDLCKCKGACCVYGDSGAPLEEEEIGIIEDLLEHILPYMTPEGREAIKKQGVFEIDNDGDYTTTLINKEECAFTLKDENGIVLCAIEKAFREGKITYKKPISCHLYPIRTKKFSNNLEGLNYHTWNICKDAIINGKKHNVKVYQGVQDAITRRWGEEFYNRLVELDSITTTEKTE